MPSLCHLFTWDISKPNIREERRDSKRTYRLKSAARGETISGSGELKSKQRAFRRAFEILGSNNRIAVSESYVWPI